MDDGGVRYQTIGAGASNEASVFTIRNPVRPVPPHDALVRHLAPRISIGIGPLL